MIDSHIPKKVSWLERALLAEITSLSSKKGFCWAKNSYFGQKFDCSTDWVSRNIARLKHRGLIDTEVFPLQGNRRNIRLLNTLLFDDTT